MLTMAWAWGIGGSSVSLSELLQDGAATSCLGTCRFLRLCLQSAQASEAGQATLTRQRLWQPAGVAGGQQVEGIFRAFSDLVGSCTLTV